MPGPRSEEQYIAEAFRRIFGASMTHADDGLADSQVDWLFALPDGREGALEVTTLADRVAMETEALAGKERSIDGARLHWVLYVRDGVEMRTAVRIARQLAVECEAAGVIRPEELPRSDDADAHRYRSSGVRLYGFEGTDSPGKLAVLRHGLGGWLGDGIDHLVPELEEILASDEQAHNLAKLRATGRPELHLAFRVHDTGLSKFELWNGVAMESTLPTGDLEASQGLAGVWLFGPFHTPVLWWSATDGWRRDDWLEPDDNRVSGRVRG
jgi:hypothetical protein